MLQLRLELGLLRRVLLPARRLRLLQRLRALERLQLLHPLQLLRARQRLLLLLPVQPPAPTTTAEGTPTTARTRAWGQA